MATKGMVQFGIPVPLHRRLLEVQARLRAEKGRQVTLPEVLETLLDRAGEREDTGA